MKHDAHSSALTSHVGCAPPQTLPSPHRCASWGALSSMKTRSPPTGEPSDAVSRAIGRERGAPHTVKRAVNSLISLYTPSASAPRQRRQSRVLQHSVALASPSAYHHVRRRSASVERSHLLTTIRSTSIRRDEPVATTRGSRWSSDLHCPSWFS
jgi:hypothetical protein